VKYSTRLVIGAVSLVLLTAVILVLVAGRWLRQDLEHLFAEELEREARVVAAAIAGQPPDLNVAAHRYGALTGRRITIMTPDGEVVGDSDFASENLADLENHADRPEVRAALQGLTGIHRRLSVSTNRVELKVAINAWPGIVRLSAPIDQVDAVVRRVSRNASVAAIVAVLAGVILAFFGSRNVARPVRQLARATTAVSAGEEPDFPDSSIAELRELETAFGTMHQDLRGRMAELDRERTDLRRLQIVRRDFVANISHELKTPLTSILGYAETILSEDPDARTRKEFLEVIHANGRRMQRLVDDLLDLARIESGAWSPHTEPVNIATMGREAWTHLAAGDGRDQPAFSVDVPEGLAVEADRHALQQILTNLFDNACRHTPATGTITLCARQDGDGVMVEVHDDGVGIPDEHLARVFERFYRVDPGRSREEGGTGLGLAIVKHLVEGHGGDVQVQSAPGEGTRVRMHFPGSTN
jgi:signal transduction histidine kinase